jgi:hypothetical protein
VRPLEDREIRAVFNGSFQQFYNDLRLCGKYIRKIQNYELEDPEDAIHVEPVRHEGDFIRPHL